MALFFLLLLFVLQAPGRIETRVAEPERSSVPVPTNVRIESYNMNPVLHWEYPIMAPPPVFTVGVKNYDDGKWKDACVNTSFPYCNIFNEIHDPSYSVWARVKATLGQEESAYVETKDFIICQHGKIGPPKLYVSKKEDKIIIDIFYPLVVINGKEMGNLFDYEDTCDNFIYSVYVRINGSEPMHCQTKGCNDTQCWSSIPVASPNTEYCASADAVAEKWKVVTEKSEEYCIVTASNSEADSFWIPLVCTSLFLIALISVFILCHTKKIIPFKRRNATLPKSLLSVVKHATSETKPESKYVSLITSYHPITSENETLVSREQLPPTALPGMHTEGAPATSEHTGEVSSETVVVVTEENVAGVIPESPRTRAAASSPSTSSQSEPCGVTVNSYHSRSGSDSGLVGSSDSGLVGSDSCSSDGERPANSAAEGKAEGQDAAAPSSAVTSFGYDKPHVLVELPAGGGGKETLIGYRLPAEAEGFS